MSLNFIYSNVNAVFINLNNLLTNQVNIKQNIIEKITNNVNTSLMEEEKIYTNELQLNILNNATNSAYFNESIQLDNKKNYQEIWEIEIPAINLIANISEGTTKETMDKYVGHFIDTNIFNGNVGLAAHNRGYPVNYFANIKDLQKEDKIIYKTKDGTKTYLVDVITIIEDDDWSYLENTKDNRITLITCVENEPKYRRCIQGIEEEIL